MSKILVGIREVRAPQIEAARKLIRELFDGITDKGGKPYAEHCERVEAALPVWVSDDARCAALLHDVVEDCGVTGGDLRRMGFSDRAVWLVLMLSRMFKEITYIDWIKSIAATGDAELIAIKLSDNLDNSDPVRIAALPPEQRDIARRYERARRILGPALENCKARLADATNNPVPLTLSDAGSDAEGRG
ncbi:MAG: HD domain-containing protein [Bosea sp.]|uniref:HD domain-containing protein n=1 Tax=Bosea sp. (in: a-proteobacteria) TaxID=1871050 RepID=UPI001AC02549|nr:HD domain-containing protein [Bosea sp. (in: a-proteobacteria)]MBN9453296.1 HD domain-containing protein [Bosea sp. (in: a-proteobacteria)]